MHRIRLGVAAAALCVIAIACGGNSEPSTDAETPDRVVGLITDIEPEEGTPTNFTVEEEDGDAFLIEIDPARDYGFDLLHVRDHYTLEDPVDVAVEEQDGELVAISIEDVE